MATKQTAIEPVSNDAESVIEFNQPYVALVSVLGTAPFLFHRWSVEGVDAKSKSAKGSKAKKSDDLESYVYRNLTGDLCIPGEYLRMAIIGREVPARSAQPAQERDGSVQNWRCSHRAAVLDWCERLVLRGSTSCHDPAQRYHSFTTGNGDGLES